jgi:Bacterial pre-peptidase C-terminal domain
MPRFLYACLIVFGPIVARADDSKPVPPKVALCSPLAVACGATTKVTLRGWLVDKATAVRCDNDNVTLKIVSQGAAAIPGKQDAKQIGDQQLELEITVAAEAPPGRVLLTVVAPDGESKPHVLLVGGDLPVIAEAEPNDGFRQAQTVAPSQIVDGQIHADGNVDVFAFELTEKASLRVEVQAQQLGSGLDSILTLYHATGAIIASNDDQAQTTDSKLESTLEPGRYFICLQDAHDRGGAAHPYRLKMDLTANTQSAPP